MIKYVLDACALIAFLRKENGYKKIKSILEKNDTEVKVYLHAASLAEVYYDFLRSSNKEEADLSVSVSINLPVEIIEIIDRNLIEWIGYFKTHYKISFADCFVLATAKIYNATIVTSDHHEFDAVEKNGEVSFEWIR